MLGLGHNHVAKGSAMLGLVGPYDEYEGPDNDNESERSEEEVPNIE